MTTSESLRKLATAGVIKPIPSYVEMLLEAADEMDELQERIGRFTLDDINAALKGEAP